MNALAYLMRHEIRAHLTSPNAAPQAEVEQLQGRVFTTATVRLYVISLFAVALLFFHWLALRLWVWLPWLASKPLPGLLVFPSLELMFLDAVFIGVSECFATLVASELALLHDALASLR